MKHLDIGLALLACGAAFATFAAEPALRWNAPIQVLHNAAFVVLPLPASAYGHSLVPGLADLRVVDAAGQRVPHAWLPPRQADVQSQEDLKDTVAYPLPRRAAPGAALAAPVEVRVQGDSIRVRRLGGDKASRADAQSPGWLFDLGERKAGQAAPQLLRLAWAGPAEFGAAFDIDTSYTLREWRSAGSGQVMALASPSGPLVQRELPLPPNAPRFVRLVWRDITSAPQLTGAQAVTQKHTAEALDLPETLQVKPSPEPAGKIATAPNALHFDLGGSLPVTAVDLQLPPGTRVAPVRLQGRQRTDEPWRELGSWVCYRIERDGTASRSTAFELQATVRYLRVLPDERSGALDPASTQLVVRAPLAKLVFASQGQPPYRLLAGAADASNGALPVGTLVPQLDQERPRLGRAQLGAWAEVAAVAQETAAAERRAVLRPWLLWAVLLAGVAVLGAMVWKLARASTVKGGTVGADAGAAP